MLNPPTFAGLEGLLNLGRQDGVDVRPTLLRVLTDQYVQSPSHTPEEVRHYTELALRLIDAVDLPSRAALAKKIAAFPGAPRPVIQRLARDVFEVAEPVLKHSPCLTTADLAAIAKDRGSEFAEIIAKRGQPDALANDLRGTAAHERVKPTAQAGELCELFFAAGGPERRLILMSLDYAPTAPLEIQTTLQRTDIWRLESAALRHNSESIIRELEQALGVSSRQARRIINDDLGEPIVVAAKAMKLPTDVLQRMLLFINPRVGQSVDRVYELAALYGEITEEAARRMVAIWRDADPVNCKPGHHESLYWHQAAENARQVLAEIAPCPAARPETRRRDIMTIR